jgi:hypothetical protein
MVKAIYNSDKEALELYNKLQVLQVVFGKATDVVIRVNPGGRVLLISASNLNGDDDEDDEGIVPRTISKDRFKGIGKSELNYFG